MSERERLVNVLLNLAEDCEEDAMYGDGGDLLAKAAALKAEVETVPGMSEQAVRDRLSALRPISTSASS
jgi:hypothetical protein